MPISQVLLGIKVLVVDDFPDAALSLAALLELKGAAARVALTGLAALTEAAAFEPHVVLLDIDLPDMSGIRVCTALRHMQWPHPLIVFAVSAWEFVDLCDRLAGFDQFFAKPVHLENLDHSLLAACGAARP